jgi:two-component system sensor histidine kinase UhpB
MCYSLKTQNDWSERKIIFIYLLLIIIASLLFYLLFPLPGLGQKNINKIQFLIQSTWLILISSGFLIYIIYFYYKKISNEIDSKNETLSRYEALSEATDDAIWDYNIITEKVFYNNRLINIFGYNRKELEDNTNWWENNIHHEDKDRVLQKMNFYLQSKKSNWEDEYRFRCKNNNYKIVYDRSFIVRNKLGIPVRLIGAMKDVTKQRTIEKNLIKKQLKNKNNLGKKIIFSHEKERKRIKETLHEDVNQILASIKLYMNDLKSVQQNETLNTSVHYLDDAINKIKIISNNLSSSTFEYFGLTAAIIELITVYKKDKPQNIDLNADMFDDQNTDKELCLLLYRIIENKLSILVENKNVNNISIELSNILNKSILKISFQSSDTTIENILYNSDLMEIRSKLEMFEGTMNTFSVGKNKNTIEVIV